MALLKVKYHETTATYKLKGSSGFYYHKKWFIKWGRYLFQATLMNAEHEIKKEFTALLSVMLIVKKNNVWCKIASL